MTSFITTALTNEPQVGTDNLPAWLLNSLASDLPDDFLQRLGQDLESSRDVLAQELNFSPQLCLAKGLIEWTDRSGSTLFVLTGALSSIGRADWIKKIKAVMEIHLMQLYVRVCEQGCGDVHYKVSTNCETSLRCALENTLGGHLMNFRIVGPASWIHWDTKARELKGQQLTLQKVSHEAPQNQVAIYEPIVRPKYMYPNTMPPNIPGGGDANYNLNQSSKEHQIEKLKLASVSNTTFSDNLMEEGLSELANHGSTRKEAADLTFESMSLPEYKEELTLDENTYEKVPMKRGLIEPVRNLSLNKQSNFFANVPCDTPEDNVDFVNLIPHETILHPGESSHFSDDCDRVLNNVPNLSMLQFSTSQECQQESKQNDLNWNCRHSVCSHNKHMSKNCVDKEPNVDQINSEQSCGNVSPDASWGQNVKDPTEAHSMDGIVKEDDDTRSSMNMDQNSEANSSADSSLNVSQLIQSNKPSAHKNTSELNHLGANSHQIDISVCSGPEYVSHFQIKKLSNMPQDVGAKRSNTPSPGGSPNMARTKRQRSLSDMDDLEEVQDSSQANPGPTTQSQKSRPHDLILESQMQKESALCTHSSARTPDKMDIAYKTADSTFRPPLLHTNTQQLEFQNVSTNSSAMQGLPIYSNMFPLKPVVYENVPRSNTLSPEKWNPEPPILSMKVSHPELNYTSGEIPETPLLCHTPPPSFPESTAQTFSTPTPSTSTPANSSRPTTQSQLRVQYSNAEAFLPSESVVYSRDNARLGGRVSGTTAIFHDRTASAGVVAESSYMDMTRQARPLATSLPVPGRQMPASSQPRGVQVPAQGDPSQQPIPPQQPPPMRPPRGAVNSLGTNHGAGVYITTSDHSSAGPQDAYNGSEEEHYHYIDHQAPIVPPRVPNLAAQLAQIPGWSPHVNGSTIQSIMKNYQSMDGNFVIWQSRRMNQFIITVSHLGNLVHYCVREMPAPNRGTIYFLYENGFRSDSLLELIHHYIQCGMRMPVSSSPGGKRYMDHIRLRRPLVVETRPRQQKGASSSK